MPQHAVKHICDTGEGPATGIGSVPVPQPHCHRAATVLPTMVRPTMGHRATFGVSGGCGEGMGKTGGEWNWVEGGDGKPQEEVGLVAALAAVS